MILYLHPVITGLTTTAKIGTAEESILIRQIAVKNKDNRVPQVVEKPTQTLKHTPKHTPKHTHTTPITTHTHTPLTTHHSPITTHDKAHTQMRIVYCVEP